MEKYFPKVGEHLYLRQSTGNSWVDMVKDPYTVVNVTPSRVVVRECKLLFKGDRYYDTVADEIEDDPNGELKVLHWAPKKGRWQVDEYGTGYPEFAVFGEWKHQPYLD